MKTSILTKYTPVLALCLLLLASSCQSSDSTQAKRQDLVDAVFASGYLITEHEYTVTANADGFLRQSLVDEGDAVSRGQQLFVLASEKQSAQLSNAQYTYSKARASTRPGSPELSQARLQVEQSKIQLQSDEQNYQRYARLVKTGAVAQVDYDRIKTQYETAQHNLAIAEAAYDNLQTDLQLSLDNAATQLAVQQETSSEHLLSSAIDGQVLTVLEQEGSLVRRGIPIAQIGGGEMIIKLFVAEEDINLLEAGQVAFVSLNTDRDGMYRARISKIYPAFDEQEQSFVVEARFEEQPAKLFPFTQLQANILVDSKRDVLTLPRQYLMKGDSVLLADHSKAAVQVGIRNMQWVEIIAGLTEDQTVIIPENEAL